MKKDVKLNIIDIIFITGIYIILFISNVLVMNLFYRSAQIILLNIKITQFELSAIINTLFLLISIIYLVIRKFNFKENPIHYANKKETIIGLIVTFIIAILIVVFLIITRYNKDTFVKHTFIYYLKYSLYILLFVSIFEEFIFRYLILKIILRITNKEIITVVMVGILFSFIHLVSLSYDVYGDIGDLIKIKGMNLLALFSMHCLFYMLNKRFKSLFPSIFIHFIWNAMLFFLPII